MLTGKKIIEKCKYLQPGSKFSTIEIIDPEILSREIDKALKDAYNEGYIDRSNYKRCKFAEKI